MDICHTDDDKLVHAGVDIIRGVKEMKLINKYKSYFMKDKIGYVLLFMVAIGLLEVAIITKFDWLSVIVSLFPLSLMFVMGLEEYNEE